MNPWDGGTVGLAGSALLSDTSALPILLKSLTLHWPCGVGRTVSVGQSGHYSEFWAVSSLCCLVSVLRLLWTAAAVVTLIQGAQAGGHSELLLLIQGYSLRERNSYSQTWKAKLC